MRKILYRLILVITVWVFIPCPGMTIESPKNNQDLLSSAPVFIIKPVNLEKGIVSIWNGCTKSDLMDFDSTWLLMENGHVSEIADITGLKLEPGAIAFLEIPLKDRNFRYGGEMWLRIEIRTKKNPALKTTGDIVAWEQFKLPVNSPPAPSFNMEILPALNYNINGSMIQIGNNIFQINFSKTKGAISHLHYYNTNRITLAPDGLTGPELDVPAEEGSPKLISIESEQVSSNEVRVVSHFRFNAKTSPIDHVVGYTVYGDGTLRIDSFIRASKRATGSTEKFNYETAGIRMALSPRFQNVEWYGYGPPVSHLPYEPTPIIQIHKDLLEKQDTQDQPGDTDKKEIRWMALTDKFCRGLLITAPPPYAPFSAAIFQRTESHVKNAKHPDAMRTQDHFFLSLGGNRIPDKAGISARCTLFIQPYDSILMFPDRFWYIRMPDEEYKMPKWDVNTN